MHDRYCFAHRVQLLSAFITIFIATPLSYWAYGQSVALNKDRLATPAATIKVTDRKRDGLNGSVRTVLTERVENPSPFGTLDDGKRTLVATAAYDLEGKKIYSTNFPTRPSQALPVGNVTRKRDGRGNVTEMVIRGTDGMLLHKETFSYEYDKLGNWTKMTTFVWMSNGSNFYPKPAAASFRTIGYFSDDYYAQKAQSQSSSISAAANAPAKKEPEKKELARATEQKPATRTVAAIQDLFGAKDNKANNVNKDSVTASKNNAVKPPSPSSSPATVAKGRPDNNHAQPDNKAGRPETAAVKPNDLKPQNAAATPTGTAISDPKPADPQPKGQLTRGAVNNGPVVVPMSINAESAKPAETRGTVRVHVNIDETGKVTSAQVESGPTVLWPAALQAALNSRFSPTLLSGRPTKVSASINFNFPDDVPLSPSNEANDLNKSVTPTLQNAKDSSASVKESAQAPVNTKQPSALDKPNAASSNTGQPKDAAVNSNPAPPKVAAASSSTVPTSAMEVTSGAERKGAEPPNSNPLSNASGSQVSNAFTEPAATTPTDPVFNFMPVNTNPPAAAASLVPAENRALENIYKVGTGDILDIHVPKLKSGQSTLYTIQSGGLLDYPAAGEPFVAAGMTTDELSARLAVELKRRALIEDDRVIVNVRDYSSHRVFISGLVEQPGPKVIQREAVPLFVLLAQAAPRPDAARAVITSATGPNGKIINISDPGATSVLVGAGDAVHVVARPQEYIYVGGEIAGPGRKDFRPGVKLTQVLLESGGVREPKHEKILINVSRQDPDGRLNTTTYNLAEIEKGKIPDPALQAGDRIVAERER